MGIVTKTLTSVRLGLAFGWLCCGWGAAESASAAIGIGERVIATHAVNVRQTPGGTFLTTRRIGDQGLVTDGPVVRTLNGFILNWLFVNFDTGVDGWVAEIGLASLSVIPPTPTNTSPGALTAPGEVLPSGPVVLTWLPVGEALSYTARILDANTGAVVASTNTTALTYTVTLPPGGQFQSVVSGCNPTGCSPDSAPLFFRTPDAIATADGDNAVFVSQTVPGFLLVGQTNVVSVTMQNFGVTPWPAGGVFFLSAINPADNLTWGLNRVALPGDVVPGAAVTFTFEIGAPLTPGTYELQWQMIREGVGLFGQVSRNAAVVVFPADAPGDNAVFVSQFVPLTMGTGTTAQASITLRNMGTNAWSEAARYRLSSLNPYDNRTWGLNRVSLPASVAPGAAVTFNFPITAPTNAGVYGFSWQMVHDGVQHFGDVNPATSISVLEIGSLGDDAVLLAQEVPLTIAAGATAPVSLTLRNAGTNTWSEANLIRLATLNPLDNLTWGFNRLSVPGEVAPGAIVTLNFSLTAPGAPGNYDFQARLVHEGVALFGPATTNVNIAVTPPPFPGNAAEFVSQAVPAAMAPGAVALVSVTFRNAGTNTWSEADKFRLGSITPIDNVTWGPNRVLLTNSVPPGDSYTFTFNIVAPLVEGNYDFQWMLVQEGVARFSDPSANAVVQVAGVPDAAPQFTAQPLDVTVLETQTATFSATAVGSPAPSLQWQVLVPGAVDFADILGATAGTFTTPSLALADNGTVFRCVATNRAGRAVSLFATVTVMSGRPGFVLQPTNQVVFVGQTAAFTVAATGTPAPQLQWQVLAPGAVDFVEVAGATAETFVTPPLTLADGGAQYRCVATNPFGAALSAAAALAVTNPPVPTVVQFFPANGAVAVPVTTPVLVTFSDAMDPATINSATFTLRRKNQSTNLATTVTYDPVTRTATLQPAVNLKLDWTYYVTVVGGEAGVKSLAGVPLVTTNAFFVTPDTLPPKLSGVTVTNITSTKATIKWTANENANAQVLYGLTSAYTSVTTPTLILKRSQSIKLTGLLPGMLYHFQVRGTDLSGNTGVSGDFTFMTLP